MKDIQSETLPSIDMEYYQHASFIWQELTPGMTKLRGWANLDAGCWMLGAAVVLLLLVEPVSAQPVQPDAKQRATTTAQQIEALLAQKAQRTPAQRKLSSQLLDMVGSQQPQAV